jgi:hypothetical protein
VAVGFFAAVDRLVAELAAVPVRLCVALSFALVLGVVFAVLLVAVLVAVVVAVFVADLGAAAAFSFSGLAGVFFPVAFDALAGALARDLVVVVLVALAVLVVAAGAFLAGVFFAGAGVVCRAAASAAAVFLAAIRPSVVTPSTLTSGADNKPRSGRAQTRNANWCARVHPSDTPKAARTVVRTAWCVCRGGPQPWWPSPAPAWAGSWALESRSCSWVSM